MERQLTEHLCLRSLDDTFMQKSSANPRPIEYYLTDNGLDVDSNDTYLTLEIKPDKLDYWLKLFPLLYGAKKVFNTPLESGRIELAIYDMPYRADLENGHMGLEHLIDLLDGFTERNATEF